jgi:hypothetical protein
MVPRGWRARWHRSPFPLEVVATDTSWIDLPSIRLLPAHVEEAGEVVVPRHDDAPVLEGERSEVRVVDEVAADPDILQQASQRRGSSAVGSTTTAGLAASHAWTRSIA